MNSKSAPIVFFGSGPVAARSLEFLLKHYEIEMVVTKKAVGGSASARAVLEVAQNPSRRSRNVAGVETPDEIRKIISAADLKSRLGVVVDFGLLIPPEVIGSFELGIVNSHFSLLPQWRGADPVAFSILSGQPETGVSLMLINERLDEGPLLAQKILPTSPQKLDSRQLTAGLLELSNELLRAVLPLYLAGKLKPYPQSDDVQPTYSRKLTKADGVIDWHKPADQLEREIRAFVDWPKSHAQIGGIKVIITKARALTLKQNARPGQLLIKDNRSLLVGCGSGCLSIDRLKPLAKPEMGAAAFLAGYGSRLT